MKLLLNQNVPRVHILNNESVTVHCTDKVITTNEHYGVIRFKIIIIIGLVFPSVIIPSGLVLFKAHSPGWASAQQF